MARLYRARKNRVAREAWDLMGMFDYVNHKDKCPKCNIDLDSFQTKDGPQNLEILEPSDVKNFYTSCKQCKTWYDYSVMTTDYYIVRKEEKL
jgi:uncharacterized protein with PIN domain